MATINAKQRFKAHADSKKWADISASDLYASAVSVAMLEMVASQNDDAAAANHYRLQGARQFLGILTNLTSSASSSPPLEQNLKTNI